jgi:hypothetical protein
MGGIVEIGEIYFGDKKPRKRVSIPHDKAFIDIAAEAKR